MKLKMDEVKFNKDGLITAIAQDEKTGNVLMLAWMNKEAFEKTLETKKAHYYSRSRQKLWFKGESSGNFQEVKKVFIDCDMDAVLLKVHQIGEAACHTGMESCFYTEITSDRELKETGVKIFDPEKVYGKQKKETR